MELFRRLLPGKRTISLAAWNVQASREPLLLGQLDKHDVV